MKKFPNNIIFNRQHKKKNMKGLKGIKLKTYNVGLRILKNSYLTYENIESARRALSRKIKPKEKTSKNIKLSMNIKKNNFQNKKKKNRKKKVILIRTNFVYQ